MIVIGIDSHKRTHTGVAVDGTGRKLAEKTVVATSAGSSGQSFALLPVTLTAVTTFVVVPTTACALTHLCSFISRPYL